MITHMHIHHCERVRMTNNTSNNRSYSSIWPYVFPTVKNAEIMEQNVFKTNMHDKCLKNFITALIEAECFWQGETIKCVFHIATICSVIYTNKYKRSALGVAGRYVRCRELLHISAPLKWMQGLWRTCFVEDSLLQKGFQFCSFYRPSQLR